VKDKDWMEAAACEGQGLDGGRRAVVTELLCGVVARWACGPASGPCAGAGPSDPSSRGFSL
jgi:hypothetical protein